MKALKKILSTMTPGFAAAVLLASAPSMAEGIAPMLDDFSNGDVNNRGAMRQYLSDTTAGGNTTMTPTVEDGTLSVSGVIAPPRGQPGWASLVLLMDAKGAPVDASAFEGIRLKIKINRGMLSVSANSTEITNFDYHAAPVFVKADGEFHEVKIPFSAMKRAWSEQTTLNTETIASLSIVAFDMQQGEYDFEVDEIGFY